MVELPIVRKLKKEVHKKIALAQDLIVKEIYNYFDRAVIHGGTAIWRCYSGERFSEDIDLYIPVKFKKSENIRGFIKSLESKGFSVIKFREKQNSIYSKLKFDNVVVSFEAVFRNINNHILKSFELSEGNFMNVYTFSPEYLIKEKTDAYLSRQKVRDLYDIFYLLNFVTNQKDVRNYLERLLKEFKDPVDIQDLKAIIIMGVVPTVEKMVEAMKRWEKQSI